MKKQRLLYGFMIILTAVAAVLAFRETQQKWIFYQQAERKFSKGKFDSAIELYQKSLTLGISTPKAYVHLADAYVADGKFSEAVPWYQGYLALYPKDNNTRLAYANALNWSGNFSEAEAEYKKVLEQYEMDKSL